MYQECCYRYYFKIDEDTNGTEKLLSPIFPNERCHDITLKGKELLFKEKGNRPAMVLIFAPPPDPEFRR